MRVFPISKSEVVTNLSVPKQAELNEDRWEEKELAE